MALGGFFVVVNVRGFFYAAVGTLVKIWAWVTVSVSFTSIGMPTLTSAFVVVGWFFIIPWRVHGVAPVAPADTTYPETTFAVGEPERSALDFDIPRPVDCAELPWSTTRINGQDSGGIRCCQSSTRETRLGC